MTKPSSKSWINAAASLGKTIPAARLHPRVLAWIEAHAKEGEPWTVAVSGGADSVALLLLLWAHFPKKRKRLVVFHFDHATRPESVGDAKFVQALAKDLGVKFATARRASGGANSEAALRDARWKFFREQLAALPARVVFFGHQRDDIAETMLMRLARGSGAGGLSAPRPVREFGDGVVALRPLLDLERDELRKALQAADASWCEDSSNASDRFLRNRLRQQVLPAWRAVVGTRDLDAAVARSRAVLEDDDEALNALAAAALCDVPPGQSLPLATLAGQPRAVWRRALRRWLVQGGAGENLNAHAFDALLDDAMAARPGRWSAGPGRWLVLQGNILALTQGGEAAGAAWKALSLTPGQTLDLPGGARLQTRVVTVDRKLLKGLKNGKVNPATRALLALPRSHAHTTFRVRLWQPGDRYRPLGAPGRRKLQDLFTDKKIPFRERRRLPVVCKGNDEPVWAPGLPPAHAQRVTAATRAALELTYCPPTERI